MVIAVICNTDYVYKEMTRKAHYDYRLKLFRVTGTANIYTKWYDVDLAVKNVEQTVVTKRKPRN